MASTIIEACNKRKMRNYSKLFEFEKVSSLCGSFRENIRCFLQDAAELEDYRVNGMPIWCTLIVSEHNGVFPLYTIEETVEHSVNPFCDHCKLSGVIVYSHDFVILNFSFYFYFLKEFGCYGYRMGTPLCVEEEVSLHNSSK